MKMYTRLFGLLLLGMVISLSSCKKDDEDDNNGGTSPQTTAQYLTSGQWKFTAMTIDPGVDYGGVVVTDFFAQLPDCTKDDLTQFNSDGSVTFDEGPTKCNPSDPQTTSGTWSLNSEGTVLTLEEPGEDVIQITITSINNSTMIGNYTLVEDFGAGLTTYTITITLAKQ